MATKLNRDIEPSPALVEQFPALKPLLANHAIARVFAEHELLAVHWARLYELLGRTALISIFLVMLLFDYEFTLERIYGLSFAVRGLGAALATIGIGAQLWLMFGKVKENWLVERFAAERLRCLKFQAFALATFFDDPAELEAEVAAFTREGIARLDQELLGGRAALDQFLPSDYAVPDNARATHASTQAILDAFKVYDSVRLGVQAQHFEDRARLSDERARLPSTLSEVAFALGGLLACGQIGVTTWYAFNRLDVIPWLNTAEPWVAFFTLLMFVSSAVLAVYQRGSADAHHSERYRHYAREIARVRMRGAPEKSRAFMEIVEQTERIELRELHDFCRDGMHSNYIF